MNKAADFAGWLGYREYIPTLGLSDNRWKLWITHPLRHWLSMVTETHGVRLKFLLDRVIDYQQDTIDRQNYLRRLLYMPQTNFSTDYKINWLKVSLTEEQRAQFRSWDLEMVDILILWANYLDVGYKLTTVMTESKQYQVSLMCQDPKSPNNKCGIQAYGNDIETAIRLVFFKAEFLVGESWKDFSTALPDFS